MIPEFTREQLLDLHVEKNRPLVICDVDEVVVHFTKSFETFLAERDLRLETNSLALAGNIKKISDNTVIESTAVEALIDQFFVEKTRFLAPIDGAVAALQKFGLEANVVMLTNLPHFAKNDRTENLKDLGLNYPVITNSGPKGPAIKHLASLTEKPIVFVDDSPFFIASSFEYAPHVNLVHFVHDQRFAVHIPHYDFVSMRTDAWSEAEPHIAELLQG